MLSGQGVLYLAAWIPGEDCIEFPPCPSFSYYLRPDVDCEEVPLPPEDGQTEDGIVFFSKTPQSRDHLSLKIDVRDQTIWKCGQEL